MTYDASKNFAKGNGAFVAAGVTIGSYEGLVQTVQWLASLRHLTIPDTAAQFLCGVGVAFAMWSYKRIANWRKHGWKR